MFSQATPSGSSNLTEANETLPEAHQNNTQSDSPSSRHSAADGSGDQSKAMKLKLNAAAKEFVPGQLSAHVPAFTPHIFQDPSTGQSFFYYHKHLLIIDF